MSFRSAIAVAFAFALALTPLRVEAGASTGADVEPALKRAATIRVLLTYDVAAAPKDDRGLTGAVARGADAILAALAAQKGASHRVHRRFIRVPALALDIDMAALRRLQAMPGVLRIDLDAGGSGAMLQAAPLAHVTDTLALGLLGSGTKVAVIDSGIDTDHADFAGRLAAEQCFCSGVSGAVGCCPNGADTMSGAGAAEDDHGHGTNVTGIAVGGGVVAQRGGAPAAQIVSVKVLDSGNSFCCASDVVAALDWVRQNHADTDVVNASLGTGALFTGICDASTSFTIALATAVNNLVQNGTMVFASSGNQRSATSISAPACVQATIAVGAVWDEDRGSTTVLGCTETTAADKATCFTNSNATIDLYAPGAAVTSSGRNGGTSTFFGTSQATPLSAGCAAALRAEFPTATIAAVEAALKASPTSIVDAKNGLSFPRLDCAAAALQLSGSIFGDGFETTP